MSDADLEPGTPWRRDLDAVRPALQAWATHTIGADAQITEVASPANGLSSETLLFDVARGGDGTGEGFAARLAPAPDLYPVFPTYDLDLQARCMRLVRERTDVPAPEVRWQEPDPRWLDAPFLVMSRIEGIAPPDIPPYVFSGWVHDATADERAQLQRGAVDVLARLHEINVDNADLSFLARPEHGRDALAQQLGYQRWYYDWARDDRAYPLIERTFAWLDAHLPAEQPAVLNWGDARIGNMLFREFTPVAVLDWEMAAVGPREVDLAWMVFLHRFFQDLAVRFEMPGLPEFMRPDDMAAQYEARTGHTPVALDWFEVFAALRFAIVSVRTSTRGIAYGQMPPPDDPDDLVMFRALLDTMLR
jgi:aminoglycoside phosphotransferase (APT) family kinase protein